MALKIFPLTIKQTKNTIIIKVTYNYNKIGYCILQQLHSKWIIKKIYVHKDFRNFKIGTKLIHASLFITKYKLAYEFNSKSNQNIISFLLKLGFIKQKHKLIPDLNKIEFKKNPYLYNYKKYYYNLLNGSILEVNSIDWINNNKYLIKYEFLIPILCDFNDLMKYFIQYKYQDSSGITIVTTYNCNLNCSYCYEKENKNSIIITDKNKFNLIWKQIDKLIKKEFSLSFFGGEPTLNKDAIYYFVDKLRKKKVKYSLKMITNGTLIDYAFVKFFKKNEFTHIQFTFDGPKFLHEKDRGYFDDIINSINLVKDITKTIGIRYNVTTKNYKYTTLFVKELNNLLSSDLKKKILISVGYVDAKNIELNYNQTKEVIKLMDNSCRKYKFNFLSKPTLRINKCPANTFSPAWIDLFGNRYFCERVIGMEKFIYKNQKGVFMTNCVSCNLYPVCGGACWAQKYFKQNYFFNCIMTEYAIKYYLLKMIKYEIKNK